MCLCFIMSSCSSVKNDPVAIAEAVVKCFKKGDFKGVSQFVNSEQAKKYCNKMQDAYDHPTDENDRMSEVTKSLTEAEYTLDAQRVDDDSAKITYRVKSNTKGSVLVIFLEKVDGKWYVKTFY